MYEEYWKLKEKPFDNNYDLRFLFLSLQHEEAITRLLYAVKDKRHGVILSGQYGAGKSIILNYLIHRIREMDDTMRIVQISDPMMTMTEFFREFLYQLDVETEPNATRPLLSSLLRKRLVDIHDQGGHTVISIDETDLIDEDTMQRCACCLICVTPKPRSRWPRWYFAVVWVMRRRGI
ncbi:MAG: AAA family ATPase [Verrucomicrobia bacterium]|nr:AAA family ATPase [Verrucomicrobiota bacterium]